MILETDEKWMDICKPTALIKHNLTSKSKALLNSKTASDSGTLKYSR